MPVRAARRIGTEDMIENDDMVVTDLLGGGREAGNVFRVGTDLGLGECDA